MDKDRFPLLGFYYRLSMFTDTVQAVRTETQNINPVLICLLVKTHLIIGFGKSVFVSVLVCTSSLFNTSGRHNISRFKKKKFDVEMHHFKLVRCELMPM